jgi:DNA primase
MDFQQIKAMVSLEKAAEFCGLELKRSGDAFRCACPQCLKGGDRGIVITPGKGFYCFGVKKGGDVIAMVAHVKGIGQLAAASLLLENCMREPEKPKRKAKKPTSRKSASNPNPRAGEGNHSTAVGGTASQELDQWETFIARL